MSEEIKTTVTEEEAMKALGEFAAMCYDRCMRDTLVGVAFGAAIPALIVLGVGAVDWWKDRRKMKKQEESPNKGSFFFIHFLPPRLFLRSLIFNLE